MVCDVVISDVEFVKKTEKSRRRLLIISHGMSSVPSQGLCLSKCLLLSVYLCVCVFVRLLLILDTLFVFVNLTRKQVFITYEKLWDVASARLFWYNHHLQVSALANIFKFFMFFYFSIFSIHFFPLFVDIFLGTSTNVMEVR